MRDHPGRSALSRRRAFGERRSPTAGRPPAPQRSTPPAARPPTPQSGPRRQLHHHSRGTQTARPPTPHGRPQAALPRQPQNANRSATCPARQAPGNSAIPAAERNRSATCPQGRPGRAPPSQAQNAKRSATCPQGRPRRAHHPSRRTRSVLPRAGGSAACTPARYSMILRVDGMSVRRSFRQVSRGATATAAIPNSAARARN